MAAETLQLAMHPAHEDIQRIGIVGAQGSSDPLAVASSAPPSGSDGGSH